MPTPSSAELPDAALITRRAALARTATLLGSALAAPTIAGVLAGCGDRAAIGGAGAVPRLKVLTPSQERLVAAVAEVIVPATTTPGARDTGVSLFVDRMLADYYPADDRDRVIAGLGRLDARALARHGRPSETCTSAQQFALVDELDALAFDDVPHNTMSPAAEAPRSSTRDSTVAPDPADVGPRAFFRVFKELAVVGFYTSEAGATRELRMNPMGEWHADVPYKALGSSWA